MSPLRVFDSKNDAVRRVLADAPTIGDSLCAACSEHFAAVRGFLEGYGIEYELVPTLVRGLDYYTRTVFEFVNEELDAAQATTCAGGRYDYLIEEIGGPSTPGVGWAAGVERMTMSLTDEPPALGLDVFIVCDEPSDRIGRARPARRAAARGPSRGHRLRGPLAQGPDDAGRSHRGPFRRPGPRGRGDPAGGGRRPRAAVRRRGDRLYRLGAPRPTTRFRA